MRKVHTIESALRANGEQRRKEAEAIAQLALLWSRAKPQYVQWLADINRLIEFEETRLQALNTVAMKEAAGFRTVMFTALGLSLMVGVALAAVISRSIVGQLGAEPVQLGQAAERVAAGDLSPVPGAAQAPAGGEVVGRVVTTMQGINDSSRKIGDIEVRSLAQRSAGAAKEIKALIHRSVEQVEQGTALVDDAGKTMGELGAGCGRVQTGRQRRAVHRKNLIDCLPPAACSEVSDPQNRALATSKQQGGSACSTPSFG